jgi:hypothetical protein
MHVEKSSVRNLGDLGVSHEMEPSGEGWRR